MAWTQDDVDALKRAIALGVLKMTYPSGASHEYRNLADMKETLRLMEAEVSGRAAAGESRSVQIVSGRDW